MKLTQESERRIAQELTLNSIFTRARRDAEERSIRIRAEHGELPTGETMTSKEHTGNKTLIVPWEQLD